MTSVQFGDPAKDFFATARREWVDLLPIDPDAAVLELGCGAGATGALALKERRCGSWIGVEANAAVAREALYALTDVHVGDIESVDLPYAGKTFDAIFLGDQFAGVAQPQRVLVELVNLLRPGGWLIASVGTADEALPGWLAPKLFSQSLRRAGLRAIRAWGASDGRRRGFLERRFTPRRYIHVEARGLRR